MGIDTYITDMLPLYNGVLSMRFHSVPSHRVENTYFSAHMCTVSVLCVYDLSDTPDNLYT